MEDLGINNTFWAGKRVLITGHTGFKGGWLSLLLHSYGAKIFGIALPPRTTPNLFTQAKIDYVLESHFCNILNASEIECLLKKIEPDIVFHLAAQPLVSESYQDPINTFDCNIMGSVHLLNILCKSKSIKTIIMVTTDKVYRNSGKKTFYREEDPLGGYDPYSASKAACEIIIESYRDSFLKSKEVGVVSVRSGNVIGGGDWSKDRLIPDAFRAWSTNQILKIRRPDAVRPWQHVLDALHGYVTLAQKVWENPELSGPYNFGPNSNEIYKVKEVIEKARETFGKGDVEYYQGPQEFHEYDWLALDTTKAKLKLGISPRWTVQEAIAQTMVWYENFSLGEDAQKLCVSQIGSFNQKPELTN